MHVPDGYSEVTIYINDPAGSTCMLLVDKHDESKHWNTCWKTQFALYHHLYAIDSSPSKRSISTWQVIVSHYKSTNRRKKCPCMMAGTAILVCGISICHESIKDVAFQQKDPNHLFLLYSSWLGKVISIKAFSVVVMLPRLPCTVLMVIVWLLPLISR